MGMADLDQIDALAQQMIEELGGVDVLVNNAGAARRRLMQKITIAEFDETMTLNFTSPMRLTLAMLPHMVERGSGHIVNVGSSGTRKFAPRTGAYVAAKAALDGFTEGLYMDLASAGVEAHLVIPGTTSTEFSVDKEGNDPPFPVRPGDAETPETVAQAIVDCLGNDDFETLPMISPLCGGRTNMTALDLGCSRKRVAQLRFARSQRDLRTGDVGALHDARAAAAGRSARSRRSPSADVGRIG